MGSGLGDMPGGPAGAGGMAGGPPVSTAKMDPPAIYIKDGKYLAEKSVPSTVTGNIGDTSSIGIKITSKAERFNGLYVTGDKSQYTLSDSTIELYGNGIDDFVGIGSAVMADGGATLTLRNVDITTYGCIRPASTSTGKSTMRVYDSTFIVHGGTLPEDYVVKIGPGMMEPPVGLEMTGTCRASLTMNNSSSYFYNTTVIADDWGALSTDSAMGHVYLEANNCNVQVKNSGYGTYADNGCENVINNTKFDVATYVGIMSGNSSINVNNIEATSGGNCVMMHNVSGKGTEVTALGIKRGKITTQKAVLLVKSANADISVDSAELISKSGVLLQSRINNDKNTTKINGQKVSGIRATFKQMTLAGDIIHGDTERTMSVAFIGTTLKGSIKGASVSLDGSSKWTATADSKVTFIDKIDVKAIDAPVGVAITAVAGQGCTLKGAYKLASGGTLNVSAI